MPSRYADWSARWVVLVTLLGLSTACAAETEEEPTNEARQITASGCEKRSARQPEPTQQRMPTHTRLPDTPDDDTEEPPQEPVDTQSPSEG